MQILNFTPVSAQHATTTEKNRNGQTITTLFKIRGQYPNGTFFELDEPEPLKLWEGLPNYDIIGREIELNNWKRWNAQPLHKGQKIEISEAIYYHLMGCLPPHYMEKFYFEVGEPTHHDEKGRAIFRACWIENGNFYTGYPKQKN
jgi:hypothetical protein